jgi:hypothetical protein
MTDQTDAERAKLHAAITTLVCEAWREDISVNRAVALIMDRVYEYVSRAIPPAAGDWLRREVRDLAVIAGARPAPNEDDLDDEANCDAIRDRLEHVAQPQPAGEEAVKPGTYNPAMESSGGQAGRSGEGIGNGASAERSAGEPDIITPLIRGAHKSGASNRLSFHDYKCMADAVLAVLGKP